MNDPLPQEADVIVAGAGNAALSAALLPRLRQHATL